MKLFLVLIFAFFISSISNAKNHDKTITKKEFLDKNIKVLEARFDAVDENKDGKITPAERKKFAEKINKQRLALLKKSTPIMMVKSPKAEEKAYREKMKEKT